MPGPSDPNDPNGPNEGSKDKRRLWGPLAATWTPSTVQERTNERNARLIEIFEALEADKPEKQAEIRAGMAASGKSREDINNHFRDAAIYGPDLRRARDARISEAHAQTANDTSVPVTGQGQEIADGQSSKPEHPQPQPAPEQAVPQPTGPNADAPKLDGAEGAANEQRLRSAERERSAGDERKAAAETDTKKKDEAESSVTRPGKEMSDAQRAKLQRLQARQFRAYGNALTRGKDQGPQTAEPDMEQ